MEAVIVAGGLGTRLWPLTQHRPKHLLPVGGVPFVAHQFAKLAAAGIRRVVLATSHQADQFEPALGDGSDWGVDLVYVTETEPLGTAGAIRHVADLLQSGPDDPVVIMNGDVLSGHDLTAQLGNHVDRRADVTLHLVEVPDARAFGCVPTDSDARVTAFLEKSPNPVSDQINAGCYVFARRMIDAIPAGKVVSVERETFPALLAEGRRVFGFVDRSYWLDIGTPLALVQASADVVRGVVTTPVNTQPPGEAWIDATADVSSEAVVLGGTCVGPDARVGAGVVVEGSVIGAGAVVEPGARIVRSAVGPQAVIGADVSLLEAVVGDGARLGAGCELLSGARVRCDVAIPEKAIRFSPDP